MYRILEARDWEPPDWVIVPGGNLGNCSAFGKAFMELKELGLIKKIPRLAVINASGANTLNELFNEQRPALERRQVRRDDDRRSIYAAMDESNYRPHTIASAIEISRPVNLPKALRALDVMNGVVREVTRRRDPRTPRPGRPLRLRLRARQRRQRRGLAQAAGRASDLAKTKRSSAS